MTRLYVVKLSGSLFLSPLLIEFQKTIKNILKKDKDLFLVFVAGGGSIARKYIAAGKSLNLDQATLDELGISISRLNALTISLALSPFSASKIPHNLSEVRENMTNRVLACGGFIPGQSTNAVGALIAENLSAKEFLNLTDVDGVYDKDPRIFKDAKKLDQISVKELTKMLESESVQAGGYDLMDPVALKLIARSKIPTRIAKCDPKTFLEVIEGKKNIGTRITF
ncbi:MAG: UMP kinase [Nitrososphaerales archaeon]